MRILVTGGAGFIGSHLVDRLMQNEKNEVSLFLRLISVLLTGRDEVLTNSFKLLFFFWGGAVVEAVKFCSLIVISPN